MGFERFVRELGLVVVLWRGGGVWIWELVCLWSGEELEGSLGRGVWSAWVKGRVRWWPKEIDGVKSFLLIYKS